MRRHPLVVLSAVVSTALAGLALSATPAQATGAVGHPAGEHLIAASATSITLALDHSANATGYRMYVSMTKADLYVADIARTSYVAATSPVLTRTGLTYSSAPVFYRIYAYSSSSHNWGDIHATGLRPPAAPTGLAAAQTDTGALSLTWNYANAAGYAVTQSTSPSMVVNEVTHIVYGRYLQYTPYGLTHGVRYYFQVRSRNYGPLSPPSAVVSAVAPSRTQDVRVMTYNIVEGSLAGQPAAGGVLASWAARKAGVIKLIRQGQPGVVAIQEAAAWVGSPAGYGGRRQIDDLVRSMPEYGLARTETPPTEHYYFRTGDYILYRKADYQPVGNGGHWDLGNTRSAAYQVVQNRVTGARMLFTSAHLTVTAGAAYDVQRQQETQVMIDRANTVAAAAHVPVVYGGDFNSSSGHALDGPAVAMRTDHVTDARYAALYRYNDSYDSANQYYRTPPRLGYSIDHFYAGAGVGIRSWGVILNLVAGQFVGVIPSDHNPVWSTIQLSY